MLLIFLAIFTRENDVADGSSKTDFGKNCVRKKLLSGLGVQAK